MDTMHDPTTSDRRADEPRLGGDEPTTPAQPAEPTAPPPAPATYPVLSYGDQPYTHQPYQPPTYPPRPQPYESEGNWVPPYPTYQTPVVPPSPRPSRRSWGIAVAIVSVLLLLALGFGIGRALTSTSTPSSTSASTIGSNGPTVNVPPSATDLQQTIISVVHTVQPSVVEVTSNGGQGSAIGSGVILTQDGYIVTNDHVVAGFNSYTVTLSNGQNKTARLVGASPQDDLAVLKIDATGLQPLAFADSGKLQVGQFAIALGSPLGFQQSATFGIVSALNRTASEGQGGPAAELTGLVQTSAPINPGNSGGALVDLQGQLIGIPTLAAANPQSGTIAEGIGFAIPSNRVKYVSQQLIQNGHLVNTGQGFLGVRGADVTPQLAAANNLPVQSGFLISGFANDASGKSPAQQAGLQTGDIIVAVNGQQIGGNADLASVLVSLSPGTQITLNVQRGNSQQQVHVTLGEKPTNLGG